MTPRRTRTAILVLSGVVLGAVLLWLVGRRIDLDQARRIFAAADYVWVCVALVCYGTAIAARVWRWHSLLSFHAAVSVGDTAVSLVVGYAVNNLLPARLGEIVRADILKRRSGASRAAALGSIFIERALDLVVVLLMLAVGLIVAHRHSAAIDEALLIGSIAALAAALLIGIGARFARRRGGATGPGGPRAGWAARLRDYASGRIGDFAGSLRVVGTRRFALAAAATLPIWLLESAAIWCVCRAIGLDLAIAALAMVMALGSLSTLLPSAPGYIGGYQLAYVLALDPWGVDATLAAVAASCVIIYLMGSLTAAGMLAWIAFCLRPSRAGALDRAAASR